MRAYMKLRAWRPWVLAAAFGANIAWPMTVGAQPVGLPTLQGPAQERQSLEAMQEPPGILTLEQAWKLALSANPALAAAGFELQAQDGSVLQAGLLPNPDIEMAVEDTQNRDTRSRTLQVSQRIELGGKRSARVGAAEGAREVAAIELEMARVELQASLRLAFAEVLLAQERLRLAEDARGVAGQAAQAVGRRVTAGKVSPVEETRARVEEGSSRVQLRQAQGELASARSALVSLWGGREPRFSQAAGELRLPESLAADVLERRLAGSAAVRRAQAQLQQRTAAVELERSRRMPDVTVSVGTKRAQDLGRSQTLVGVSIPLPLFDRNQGNVLEALRRADKSRSELYGTENNLALQIAQAHERLSVARQEAELLRTEILPGARSAYQAASKGYELGKFAYLDVLDAQRTYFQVQFQYLNAMAQAYRAQADIDRVLGAAGLEQE